MRRLILSVCSMVMLGMMAEVSLAQSRSKKEPEFTQLYESDKVSFQAYFTEKPRTITKKHDTKAGSIIVTTVSVDTRDLIYAVVETTYDEKFKEADPAKLLAAACDGLSANGGKLISSESITITGKDDTKHKAKEVIVEFNKTRVRTRIALVDLTLIQASVTGKESAVTSKPADQFLRAVELKK